MYTSIVYPQFNKNEQDAIQFQELKSRVYAVVKNMPRSRHRIAVAKAFLFPPIYFSLYAMALFSKSYLAFCLAFAAMGLMLVIMFLNLIHEACHQTLFASKKANQYFMLLFDIMGANSYMWKKRHVRLHHNYPNLDGWDSDIEKSSLLKVHPKAPRNRFSRYQHLVVLLYPLFITNWFLARDFIDFFSKKAIVRKLGAVPAVEYLKLFFFKLLFVGYIFVIPLWATAFSWVQVLAASFLLLIVAGAFALPVLIPPHVNTGNQFPTVNQSMQLQHSWLLYQLCTTNDVSGSNWCTRHVLGNCNFHIAHHLFPNISYVYAKEVTEVIRTFCREKGMPYRAYPLHKTFVDHYRLIKQNGQPLNIWEEDM